MAARKGLLGLLTQPYILECIYGACRCRVTRRTLRWLWRLIRRKDESENSFHSVVVITQSGGNYRDNEV